MVTRYAVGDSDERPWGRWEVLAVGDCYTVKRITVKPKSRLSYQYHHHREEHWVIAEGRARVTLDGAETVAPLGTHVHIPKGARHRIENPGEVPVVFIEVQQGEVLDEDDIVRVEDDFGRA